MNAYLKGAIFALIAIAALFVLYKANENKLPVNQSPEVFNLISKMETEGMPDFTLPRLDGSQLQLSSLKGKVLVVNFWASWCNPCVEEFASMVKLADRMHGDLVVVAVSTDENKSDIEPFLKIFGLPRPGFEVVWDKDKKIMQAYGVGKIPESYLVKTDFRLARKILGVEKWDSDEAVRFFQHIKDGDSPTAETASDANQTDKQTH